MKIKRYGVNVRKAALQLQENRVIYKSRGLHKAFNKGGIPLLVKSSKSHPNKKSCMRKTIMLLLEYYHNKTFNTKTNL